MSKPTADELIEALSRTAREIAEENAGLERLARGESSTVEGADPRLREAAERLPEEIQRKVFALAEKATRPPKVAPLSLRRVLTWTAPLLVAASIALFVLSKQSAPELPVYALEIVGSQNQVRAAPKGPNTEGTVRLGDSAPLVVVARPTHRPSAPIEARAFGRARAGAKWLPLEADVRVAEEGSARVQLQASILDDVDELRIVISARGTPLEAAERRAEQGDALGLQLEHPAR